MAGTAYVLACLISVQVAWVQSATWGYAGGIGPTYWSANYPICSGTQQSPIDIQTHKDVLNSSLGAFTFSGYSTSPTSYTLTNNGHTLGVTVGGSMTVSNGGLTGTKIVHGFHFHWGSDAVKGSEHTLDGTMYPMELHIVHYDSSYPNVSAAMTESKGLAVLGFFFEIQAADNTNLDPIVSKISSVVNDGQSVAVTPFPMTDILSGLTTKYYRYDGSLTTPGCYESVEWTVFDSKIGISASQLATFRTAKFTDTTSMQNNNRPVQAIGGRTVYSSFDSSAGVIQPQLLLIATLSAAILFIQKDC